MKHHYGFLEAHYTFNWANMMRPIKSFDKAIELNPNQADAWQNRTSASAQLNYDEALKSIDKAIELNPIYANEWCREAHYKVKKGNVIRSSKFSTRSEHSYGTTFRPETFWNKSWNKYLDW